MQPFNQVHCLNKKNTMRQVNIIICILIIFCVAASCTKTSLDKSTYGVATPGTGSYSLTGGSSSGGDGGTGGANAGDTANHTAGVLTAGEWNDFDNWPYWLQLNNNDTIKAYQTRWAFYPNQKWVFTVKDNTQQPVADADVTIKANATEIWKGKTNRFGILQVMPDIFSASLPTDMQYSITYNNMEYATGTLTTSNPDVAITISTTAAEFNNVDLMFVVDATGSMSDEITYLQKELQNVLNSAGSHVPGSLRYAGIFYRDFGDEYLTRINEFSPGNTSLLNFVADQNAGGGGDYPEAVEEALKAAVQQQWSSNARARIIFLILDAPVHDDEQKIDLLKQQVKLAAAKGIIIIPIAASGTDKPAEFLFRYMALATNGTYTFLTDDSGIGNSHIAPTVGHYNVEFLNDLVVRLITKYGGN